MEAHQTTIQIEEDTPLLSNSKYDTSPPKKRVKHGSDFDSSQQKRVFNLGLPKHKPGLEEQWHAMFNFLIYDPKRSTVFKDLVSKCRKEVEALESAFSKAESFVKQVLLDFEKERHHPYAYTVIKTITSGQELVVEKITQAKKEVVIVENDVYTYCESVDNIIFNRSDTSDQYFKKLAQFVKIPDVGKMIKYFEFKGINYEEIKDCSGLVLTPEDISDFIITSRWENKFYFDDVDENFGQHEMECVLEQNMKSIGELQVLREAFEKADAKLKEQSLNYESHFIDDVDNLLHCLYYAGEEIKIRHKQLELLHEKKVAVTGYYDRFIYDWRVASTPDPVVVDTPDPVDVDSTLSLFLPDDTYYGSESE